MSASLRTRCLALLSTTSVLLALCVGCGGGGGGSDSPVSGSDPISAADIAYALTALNAMRAAEAPGAAALVRDAGLDAYALASNDVFDADRLPHTYAGTTPLLPSCPAPIAPASLSSVAAENEGLAGVGLSNPASIDAILAFYLAEKSLMPGDPARGHYEAIINPGLNSVGIAIKRSAIDGFFVMTQEFCD